MKSRFSLRAQVVTLIGAVALGALLAAVPARADTQCQVACGTALQACANSVLATLRACVSACRTRTCDQACLTAAEASGKTCAANFEACLTACPTAP